MLESSGWSGAENAVGPSRRSVQAAWRDVGVSDAGKLTAAAPSLLLVHHQTALAPSLQPRSLLVLIIASPTRTTKHPRHTQTRQQHNKMDSLVAQYSRPAFKDAGYQEQEQLELIDAMPTSLNLKFALPPVAQVSLTFLPSTKACI